MTPDEALEVLLAPSARELEIKAKRRAHAAFDPIWQRGQMTRPMAYAWLTAALGRTEQVHIKDMRPDECECVVTLSLIQRGYSKSARQRWRRKHARNDR